jgi:hypothetical protein
MVDFMLQPQGGPSSANRLNDCPGRGILTLDVTAFFTLADLMYLDGASRLGTSVPLLLLLLACEFDPLLRER